MTAASPRFVSLAAQVADALRDKIRSQTWTEWLPSERTLAETLQVSRKTLRKALAQLQREGTVEVVSGLGHRIVAAKDGAGRSVVEPVVG